MQRVAVSNWDMKLIYSGTQKNKMSIMGITDDMTFKNYKMLRRKLKGLNEDSMFKNRKVYTSISKSHFFPISSILNTIPNPHPKPSMVAHHCNPRLRRKSRPHEELVEDQPQLCMSSYKAMLRLAWIAWSPSLKTKTDKLLIFNLKSIWEKKVNMKHPT